MKPVTTISGETESTDTIDTCLERASSFIRVKYSLVLLEIKGQLSDGGHIGLLIMTILQALAPQFIQEKRLCWLRSPLYIVKNGKVESYYFTDEEFNKVRGKIKGEVQRNKGLGALSAEQARRSMFSEEFQRIEVIEPDAEGIDLLTLLMGEDIESRKEFVFNEIDFSEVRE